MTLYRFVNLLPSSEPIRLQSGSLTTAAYNFFFFNFAIRALNQIVFSIFFSFERRTTGKSEFIISGNFEEEMMRGP